MCRQERIGNAQDDSPRTERLRPSRAPDFSLPVAARWQPRRLTVGLDPVRRPDPLDSMTPQRLAFDSQVKHRNVITA